jgi:hypothetical protein
MRWWCGGQLKLVAIECLKCMVLVQCERHGSAYAIVSEALDATLRTVGGVIQP